MSPLLDFLRAHDEAFRSRPRLASLYSDFRSHRHTNPDGYRANAAAWLRALAAAAAAGLLPSRAGGRFVLETGPALLRALHTPEYGPPLALAAVLHDAVEERALVPLEEFLAATQSVSRPAWIPTPRQLFRWTLRHAGLAGGGPSPDALPNAPLVVLANVERAADAVLAEAEKRFVRDADRVFSTQLFGTALASSWGVGPVGRDDVDVLLTHLARDRAALAYDRAAGVVKFKAAAEAQPAPVTAEDRSIASLRTLIARLQPEIDTLARRIAEADRTARAAVSDRQTVKAKTALRQKKLADAALQQRSRLLAQLEAVSASIEQASDHVHIVQVLAASAQTLKSLNAQAGGVDTVSDVTDDLREHMRDTEQIGHALGEPGAAEIDEAEVADELEALEQSEAKRAKAEQDAAEAEPTRLRLAELPSAPRPADLETPAEAPHARILAPGRAA